MTPLIRRHTRSDGERGQALVEFSLVIIVLLFLVMAIFDFGRAIYQYNGADQAAREIARVASVHPGTTFGSSTEITNVINVQKRMVPNLGNPVITCIDIAGNTVTGDCSSSAGHSVKVTIGAPYSPITPLLGLTGTWNMISSSSALIQ